MNSGAVIWARQTIESEIFFNKPDKWFKIWFYLVGTANHKDNKQFKRGQCFMKYDWISEKTKANKNEIDHCIRWLKSATQITTQKATRGFIITICNYSTYQNLKNYKSDTKSESKSDLKAKQKRNESDTINKNDKNDKNVIIEINKEKFPFLEDNKFSKTFNNFISMRKRIKKEATDYAQELILTKLHGYDIKTAIAMIEQSIIGSWQGVFELKPSNKPQQSKLRKNLQGLANFAKEKDATKIV